MGGAWPIATLLLDETNLLLALRGTKHAELARKLRFVGASLDVRVDQIDEAAKHAKAS